ncbi:calcium homeostasis modulator protein 5 [Rhinophrynus dorsalis]
MDVLQKFMKFCDDRKYAFGYGFMALMTVGGQQIFSVVAFQCPCSHQNIIYGMAFLFAPAVVFLIVGYLVSSRTWKFFTGCCVNPRKICPKSNRCLCLYVFMQLTMNALVLPVMWISIALLNGTFYTCAMSGLQNPENLEFLCKNKSEHCFTQLYKIACGKSSMSSTESEEVIAILQAQSQVLGWCLILTSALISLLITCYSNCNSKVSSLQLTFWKMYIEKEKEKFDELAQEYASKLADRNLRSFFENKEADKFEMPSNKSWEDISSLYTFNPSHQYYSTIHRFVEHGNFDKNEKERMMDFVV